MQVNNSQQAELENTIQMIENGIQILRDSPTTGVTLKTLSVIAAIVKHQEAKIRAAENKRNDEIEMILLRV